MRSTKGIFIAAVIGTSEIATPPQPGKDINMRPQTFKVDSDSFIIRVDGHATQTISNNPDHFITPIQRVKKGVKQPRVEDFGGGLTNIKGFGTVRWRLEDDDGKI
jgi:hypothetical protein